LELEKNGDNHKTVLSIKGSVKTLVAAKFSEEISSALRETEVLILDFENVTYIASSGLRALLTAQQYVDENEGTVDMIIKNINDEVREVFESTGFINVLKIEG
jgi:anti-sigma B factor antagonist